MSITNANVNGMNTNPMMIHPSLDTKYQLHRGFSTSSEQLSTVNPSNGSPTHVNGAAIPRHHSDHSGSPLNLSSVLNTLSISSGNQPQTPSMGSFLLKLRNIPSDISLREAHALFALAHGVLSIDVIPSEDSQPYIVAKFDSQHLACQYASILNIKSQIFGPMYPFKVSVEVIDELTNQQLFFQTNSPQLQPQLNTNSFQIPSSGSVSSNVAPTLTSPPQSSSRKRPSLLGQRSRFSFSDPFSSENPPLAPLQATSQTPFQNIDAGKSFLLMEGDGINDTIWGSNPSLTANVNNIVASNFNQQAQPQSQQQQQPQSQQQQQQQQPSQQPQSQSQPQQIVDWSNSKPAGARKTSGSIFAGPQQANASVPALQSTPDGNSQLTASQQINGRSSTSISSKPVTPTSSTSHTPHKSGSRTNINNTSSSAIHNANNGGNINNSNNSNSNNNSQSQPITRSVASVLQNTPGISQVDLSLLARVPPPANPADQNPPCNTLYVGNLPPDATEQELRQLFGSQKGFKRLSFRNKNNNNSGHGPMCFVEFEDVAHATRALAELYGSQLPRPVGAHNTKGGIRLSFSKNPLGVRGPNSRRSGSSGSGQSVSGPNNSQSSNGISTNPNSTSNNNNGSGSNSNIAGSSGNNNNINNGGIPNAANDLTSSSTANYSYLNAFSK